MPLHLTPEQSSWLLAALLTLIAAPFLAFLIPRCSHAECRKAHEDASTRERTAARTAEIERLHAFHDRLRPQLNCPICQLTPCPDCAGRNGCRPECQCASCAKP